MHMVFKQIFTCYFSASAYQTIPCKTTLSSKTVCRSCYSVYAKNNLVIFSCV